MKNDDFKNQTEDEDVIFEDLNAEGEEMSPAQKVKHEKEKLKEKFGEKIERLEKERDEYLSGWQRIQADYKNREKELESYKKEVIKFANSNLVTEILPILDGYEIAKSHTDKWEAVDKDWRMGVEYLFAQLLKVLESNGVQVFGEVGETYDPHFHEAIELVELPLDEKENSGKIVYVLQKGYKIGEKILRVARVKVGKIQE